MISENGFTDRGAHSGAPPPEIQDGLEFSLLEISVSRTSSNHDLVRHFACNGSFVANQLLNAVALAAAIDRRTSFNRSVSVFDFVTDQLTLLE